MPGAKISLPSIGIGPPKPATILLRITDGTITIYAYPWNSRLLNQYKMLYLCTARLSNSINSHQKVQQQQKHALATIRQLAIDICLLVHNLVLPSLLNLPNFPNLQNLRSSAPKPLRIYLSSHIRFTSIKWDLYRIFPVDQSSRPVPSGFQRRLLTGLSKRFILLIPLWELYLP